MLADISLYAGREQAYVKHFFLDNYLERLIYKTASKYEDIAYVDGFSGPWQSTGEAFSDTSFGIALKKLREAKEAWKVLGRNVRMTAHLVEKAKGPFAHLQDLQAKFPDIQLEIYNQDFMQAAPEILRKIPRNAFAFFLLDPKGWRIDMSALAPLLRRPNSEVVFNFMFDFINRAASMSEPAIVAGLDQLIPQGDWRLKLQVCDSKACNALGDSPRKKILVEAFSQTLMKIGGYEYVAETPILRPLKDRTLYSLIYATRASAGIHEFRDCQRKTFLTQEAVRGEVKHSRGQDKTKQGELFEASVPVQASPIDTYLDDERAAAEKALLKLVPEQPDFKQYGRVWPRVLSAHAVRKMEVDAMANRLRKEERLAFPEWGPRIRVPKDDYRIARI